MENENAKKAIEEINKMIKEAKVLQESPNNLDQDAYRNRFNLWRDCCIESLRKHVTNSAASGFTRETNPPGRHFARIPLSPPKTRLEKGIIFLDEIRESIYKNQDHWEKKIIEGGVTEENTTRTAPIEPNQSGKDRFTLKDYLMTIFSILGGIVSLISGIPLWFRIVSIVVFVVCLGLLMIVMNTMKGIKAEINLVLSSKRVKHLIAFVVFFFFVIGYLLGKYLGF
jgi:hypothetical protein